MSFTKLLRPKMHHLFKTFSRIVGHKPVEPIKSSVVITLTPTVVWINDVVKWKALN